MEIPFYLAMTAAECAGCRKLPAPMGWLACHFSPSGPGLSNMPKTLPENSLLFLDDSIPFCNHQPELILRQLEEAVSAFSVNAVILDFQRPGVQTVRSLVQLLQTQLPCPVVSPPAYAADALHIFVPPCPLHRPLQTHLAPYLGKEIWLDVSPLPAQITVSAHGSTYETVLPSDTSEMPHFHSSLHCHYGIKLQKDRVLFTLSRNMDAWLQEMAESKITAAIGLWQELR